MKKLIIVLLACVAVQQLHAGLIDGVVNTVGQTVKKTATVAGDVAEGAVRATGDVVEGTGRAVRDVGATIADEPDYELYEYDYEYDQ